MTARHIEFLVEEPSVEAFLGTLLPRLFPDEHTFVIHAFQGKSDLLKKLGARLRGYRHWLPPNGCIVVMVDRDDEDCHALKQKLEEIADSSGLRTRSKTGGTSWQVVNRIVIEELEAWYFGDWQAVRCAYPRVSKNIPQQERYRNPDAISGGTWEAFERILQRGGYFKTGLRKIEAAQAVAEYLDPLQNKSHSFAKFRDAIFKAIS